MVYVDRTRGDDLGSRWYDERDGRVRPPEYGNRRRFMPDLPPSIKACPLATDSLPTYAAHHAAKHQLLRVYAHAWLPKLGFRYPQTAIVDAFASAGRYRNGRPGSPLILLQAYIGRDDQQRFMAPPHFVFIESRREFATSLRAEIDALGDLKGARVDVLHGTYEKIFPKVIDFLAAQYQAPLPVFTFVDPRGYKETPFALIQSYRRRLGDKAEAMIYLPVNFMARFAMTDLTQKALERVLGAPEAVDRVRQHPDHLDQGVGERIADEYADRLRGEFAFVTDFTVDPIRHNEYYLFFGTGSDHGIREMKRAYWKVDPVGGAGYRQDKQAAIGQGSFFDDSHTKQLPYEATMPALLRNHFGTDEFTIEQAALWTLHHTRFLDEGQLRRWGLIPLQAAGTLEVIESTRRQANHFPPGTRMRFVA